MRDKLDTYVVKDGEGETLIIQAHEWIRSVTLDFIIDDVVVASFNEWKHFYQMMVPCNFIGDNLTKIEESK